MSAEKIDIVPVSGKKDLSAFIDIAYRINEGDPNWVPPLRADMVELLTPGRNPFHEHARMQLFIARSGGRDVGRISAHIDELALAQPVEQGMGPGTGNWGLLEAESEEVAYALIARAEEWLRAEGMTRVLAPISLSIWEEPGLLTFGHDHPPMVMMGHDLPQYEGWIENAGYVVAKKLFTFDVDVAAGFPPIVQRIVESGERNERIRIRNVDKKNYRRDTAIVIDILNDAWSGNWGFVPFSESEKHYAATKLKPIILEGANKIAELDGQPVAFMLTLPDLNQKLINMKGKLFPFNWARLLLWLRNPRGDNWRVPLMGVVRKHQSSRMASQLAFMMIESIRLYSVDRYGGTRAEIGWILEDNQGMVAIADAINAKKNREYRIYEKAL